MDGRQLFIIETHTDSHKQPKNYLSLAKKRKKKQKHVFGINLHKMAFSALIVTRTSNTMWTWTYDE